MDTIRFTKESLVASAICGFARLLTGARAIWKGCAPAATQRIYYGNHTSHGDFVLIYASLPADLRVKTRPVAGADYWSTTPLKRWIANDVLGAVMIERQKKDQPGPNPVEQLVEALDHGDSLILFPEGTRNTSEAPLLEFKSGIYHAAAARPEVECVPVWIENLNRVMPKGEFVPIPLLCTLTFGEPQRVAPDEDKDAFLVRLRNALLGLAPPPG